jgi:hypothetical protein
VLWPNLVGKARNQPDLGRWHEWKETIAAHCDSRCVYCAIHEGRFGGIRNFHIEHFRPKVRFPHLENHIANLYLACAICNVLKSDDWPGDPVPDHSVAAYPDPSVTDYNTLFTVSPETHQVSAATFAGKYVIERILLNRAQLILERRLAAFLRSLSEFENWVVQSVDNMNPAELKELSTILLEIGRAKTSVLQARPYRDADTKRAVKAKAAKRK